MKTENLCGSADERVEQINVDYLAHAKRLTDRMYVSQVLEIF